MTNQIDEVLDDFYPYTMVEKDVASETMKIWFFETEGNRTFSVRMMRPEKNEVFEARVGVELKVSECNPQTLRVKDTSTPPSNIVKFYSTVVKIVQEVIDVDSYASKKKAYMMAIPVSYFDRVQRFALRVAKQKLRASIGNLYFEPTPRTTGRNTDYYCMFMGRRGFDMAKIIKPDVTFTMKAYNLDTLTPSAATSATSAASVASVATSINQGTSSPAISLSDKKVALQMFTECFVSLVLMYNYSKTAKATFTSEGQVKFDNIKEGVNKEPSISIKHLVHSYGLNSDSVSDFTKMIYRLKTRTDTVLDINLFTATVSKFLTSHNITVPQYFNKLFTSLDVKSFLTDVNTEAKTPLFKSCYTEYKTETSKPMIPVVDPEHIYQNMKGYMSWPDINTLITNLYGFSFFSGTKCKIPSEKVKIFFKDANLITEEGASLAVYFVGYVNTADKNIVDENDDIVGVRYSSNVLRSQNIDPVDKQRFLEHVITMFKLKMINLAYITQIFEFFDMFSHVSSYSPKFVDFQSAKDWWNLMTSNSLTNINGYLPQLLKVFLNPGLDVNLLLLWYIHGVRPSYILSNKQAYDDNCFNSLKSVYDKDPSTISQFEPALSTDMRLKLGIDIDKTDLSLYLSKYQIDDYNRRSEIKVNDISKTIDAIYASPDFRSYTVSGYVRIAVQFDLKTFDEVKVKKFFSDYPDAAVNFLTISDGYLYNYESTIGPYLKTLISSGVIQLMIEHRKKISSLIKGRGDFLCWFETIQAIQNKKPVPSDYILDMAPSDNAYLYVESDVNTRALLYIATKESYGVGSDINVDACINDMLSEPWIAQIQDVINRWVSNSVDVTSKTFFSILTSSRSRDIPYVDEYTKIVKNFIVSKIGVYLSSDSYLRVSLPCVLQGVDKFNHVVDNIRSKIMSSEFKLQVLSDTEIQKQFLDKVDPTNVTQTSKFLLNLFKVLGHSNEIATVIEPMYDAFIDKLIKVNFRSYTKEITLILDYYSDNEKFNELKSKTLKKIHQSGNLSVLVSSVDKSILSTLVNIVDLDDKQLISDFADSIVENFKYGPELVRQIFLPVITSSAVMSDMMSSEIKPMINLTVDRVKQILSFNKIDVKALDLKIRKSPKETYGQMFERLIDQIEQSNSKLPEQKVTVLNESDDELELKSIQISKSRNNKHGKAELRILKSWDANVVFPEYDAYASAHPNRTVKRQMYHCTGSVAASMVLRCGFTIIPSSDPSAVGRMLGDGIYCTNVIDKAQQYLGDNGYSRAEGTTGYVFEMEVQYDKRHPRDKLTLRDPQFDWAAAGLGGDNIRSPEWALLDPKSQVKIYRVHKAVIISQQQMERLRTKHDSKVNETKYIESKMSSYLKSHLTEAAKSTVMFTFGDGQVPVEPGKTQWFDTVNLKQGMQWDYSMQGPMLCVDNNLGLSGHYMIPDTNQLKTDDPEHILPMIYNLFK